MGQKANTSCFNCTELYEQALSHISSYIYSVNVQLELETYKYKLVNQQSKKICYEYQ